LGTGQAPAGVYTADESQLLADAPPDLSTAVDVLKRYFLDAEVVRVRSPRQHLADLIREARQRGDREFALNLRKAFRERAAIMKSEAVLPRSQAEAPADTLSPANLKELFA